MKTVTTLWALFQYAGALGDARRSKDPERIRKAQEAHDAYVQLCLEADEMHTGLTYGDLSGKHRSRR